MSNCDICGVTIVTIVILSVLNGLLVLCFPEMNFGGLRGEKPLLQYSAYGSEPRH
jgi:hypothetical protein